MHVKDRIFLTLSYVDPATGRFDNYCKESFTAERYKYFLLCKRNTLFFFIISFACNWIMHDVVMDKLEKRRYHDE